MQLGGLFQHEGQIAFVRSPYLKDMKVQHAHDLQNIRSVNVKGGGQTFFGAFINSELGPPEVAPYMARTFGRVSGHRRRTGSEPRPAQIWSQK